MRYWPDVVIRFAAGRAVLLVATFIVFFTGLTCAQVMPEQRRLLRIDVGTHSAAIRRMDVSADGQLMVTGSLDKTARLWSLPEGKLLRTFRVPIGGLKDGEVYAVAISPDGRLVASDSQYKYGQGSDVECFIYLFDTISGEMRSRLGPLPDLIRDLSFSPDGKLLAAGLFRHSGVRLWRKTETGQFDEQPSMDRAYGAGVFGVSFSNDGRRLATASMDGKVRLYDVSNGTLEFLNSSAEGIIDKQKRYDIAFSPQGDRVAVSSYEAPDIVLLDAATLQPVIGKTIDTSFAAGTYFAALEWSADGSTLFAGGSYDANGVSRVIAWDMAGSAEPRFLGGPQSALPENAITDLAALPDGSVAWVAFDPAIGSFGPSGEVRLGIPRATADMRQKRQENLAISPDASGVWFGLKQGNEDPWVFDVNQLTFDSTPEMPKHYLTPRVDNTPELPIKDWINNDEPQLHGKRLTIESNESSRSLAIAPDGQSFVLGAQWALYRFSSAGELIWRIPTPGTGWGVNLSAEGKILIAALGDGTVRWFNAETGAELLAFFVHTPSKRWVAWTPSGYFAASPGGEDLIGWHLNGKTWNDPVEFFPASRFRDRFYRPDIIKLVLKTKDEARAITEANAKAKRKIEDLATKDLPPVIEIIADPRGIETNERDIELRYQLRTPSGRKVSKIEIRIDGALQAETGRGVTPHEDPSEGTALRITVPPRDSIISLVPYHDGQDGVAASVPVRWTGAVVQRERPKLQALLVGISAYDDPALKLSYAHKDAADLAEALRIQAGPFFAPDPKITLLQDHDANPNAILRALKALHKAADDDTYTVVLFAGHGRTSDDGAFWFLPATARKDDEPEAGGIAGDTIYALLGKIRGKVVLFVDACHAANGIQGSAVDMTGLLNSLTVATNSIMMYASSQGRELSLESAEWENGAFTEALLSILATPDAYGADRLLFNTELEEQLTKRVLALTRDRQTAVANKSKPVPPFPIAGL